MTSYDRTHPHSEATAIRALLRDRVPGEVIFIPITTHTIRDIYKVALSLGWRMRGKTISNHYRIVWRIT